MPTDEEAIRSLLQRQFESLSWSPEKEAGWNDFTADFLPDAPLYGASRPAKPQTADGFVARMKQLSTTSLPALDERLVGFKTHVFGNIAVVFAVCELNENDTEVSRNVEAMLLIKDGERWRSAAQAWDTEGEGKPIPPAFLEPSA